MSRKLATIQMITKLDSIIGADNIEVASILGWKVVVKKGDFKVGDAVIYCEIDSLLPVRPEFEFLRKNCYKKNENGEGFRIKTIRLKGQISQGICFHAQDFKLTEKSIGEDVTEYLEISQYIPQIPQNISGLVKGSFPSFMPKTDETRVQVLQDILSRHKGKNCYVTEKVDGCSVTYYYKDGEFGVCSRNLELKNTEDNLLWKMARKYEIEQKLKGLDMNIAIQGELIGTGVCKNNLRLLENKVLFFSAFDINVYKYLDHEEFFKLINDMGLEIVPLLQSDYILSDNIDELIEKSKGTSVLNKKVFREGIVIRPLIETFDLQLSQGFGNGRLSFKVINPDYLLKFSDD